MDNDSYLKMYHHVVMGVPKNQSRHVTDDESSKKWDILANQVQKSKEHGYTLDTVHDIP